MSVSCISVSRLSDSRLSGSRLSDSRIPGSRISGSHFPCPSFGCTCISDPRWSALLIMQRSSASQVRWVADSSATSASSGSTTPTRPSDRHAWSARRRIAASAIHGVRATVGNGSPR